jgi:hypothetical protein
VEHECGRGGKIAGREWQEIRSRLESGIAAKLFGVPPMKNLRFTIGDLRLALQDERCAGLFLNRQSAIGSRQSFVSE